MEETEIREVQVDALAALRIIKHCREALPSTVTGQIQGVDNDGVLQITHSFPFTASGGGDDFEVGEIDYDDMDGSQYQVSMLKRLRQMNYDVNTCGWYRTADAALFESGVVEDQYTYQKTFPHSVVLVYDPSRLGNLSLVAYRLTPKFMQMRSDSTTGRFSLESLVANKLTFSKVFQPVPVRIHNTSLAAALMQQLMYDAGRPDISGLSVPSPTFDSHLEETTTLSPNFDNLELTFDNYLESRLENMIQEVENQGQDMYRWTGWQRNVGREQSRVQQTVTKRKAENAQRAALNQPPLWSEEDLNPMTPQLAKIIANEPTRLDLLLIQKRLDTNAQQTIQFAGPGMTRMFGAKTVQK
ncbi:hypothetical protein DFJ74DRAFT_698742 [Hyaloraphidium curvatum]|nr:hypothetical protein DFJ74DRAFT_698742 [Hyaloraphidium curvatum]